MTTTNRKSPAPLLRCFDDPETTPRVEQLHGRPLLPVQFTPETGRPVEPDGAALTKFGWAFREAVARIQNLQTTDVPLGLVRLVEALNADTDDNLAGLARPAARYTEYGMLWSVPLLVNVPLLMGWLINGRALRGIASELARDIPVVTAAADHEVLSLPTMHVEDPDQVLELLAAQRRLLGFDRYAGDERDLCDSIATNGVLDPLDVVPTQLVSKMGSAWTAQTSEGARRLFGSQLDMTIISNRDAGSLATKHWFGGPAGFRELDPQDLTDLAEALTFPDSAAAAYFPGKDRRTWIDRTAAQQPAAVTWQLIRTVRINLIIAIEPNERAESRFPQSKSAVVQELIRHYHVGGKAKRNWQQADVDGVAAITLLDTFRGLGRITAEERAAWLGQSNLPWDNPLEGIAENANLLASVVRLIGILTVRRATVVDLSDGLDIVQQVLRDNGASRPQPSDRARVAAAQALVPLGQHNSGQENQISAALQALYRDPLLWKTDDYAGGPWTQFLGLPLDQLEVAARQELAEKPSLSDPARELGPARRALGALGMTALIVNPALLADGKAVTRTGRGGGGKAATVSAADPSKLLMKMLLDIRGLDQLVDAITALVAGRAPAAPADRETNEVLGDLWLRELWFGNRRAPGPDSTPYGTYVHRLTELVDVELMAAHNEAEYLRRVTEAEIVGEEADGEEDAPMYERFGVPEELADRARARIKDLDEFFNDGRAIARASRRNGR